MMKLWKYWDTDTCPCCQSVPETTLHLLECPNEQLLSAFHIAVNSGQLDLGARPF